MGLGQTGNITQGHIEHGTSIILPLCHLKLLSWHQWSTWTNGKLLYSTCSVGGNSEEISAQHSEPGSAGGICWGSYWNVCTALWLNWIIKLDWFFMTSKRFCSSVFNVLVLVFLVKVSSLLVFMDISNCNFCKLVFILLLILTCLLISRIISYCPAIKAEREIKIIDLGQQLGEVFKHVGAVEITVIVDVELSYKAGDSPQLDQSLQSHLLHLVRHLHVLWCDDVHQFLQVHLPVQHTGWRLLALWDQFYHFLDCIINLELITSSWNFRWTLMLSKSRKQTRIEEAYRFIRSAQSNYKQAQEKKC